MSRLRRIRLLTARDDGLSMVEVLISIVVLGVILTALAGSIIYSLRTVARNERETEATAISIQVTESLQTKPWTSVALYEDDITAVVGDPDRTRWRARLDGDGKLNGLELVTQPGGAIVADRDPIAPLPSETFVRRTLTFDVDTYIVWVDKDADGVVETKRFVTIANYQTPNGDTRETRFESERIPTQNEAESTVTGVRVLSQLYSPNPSSLYGPGDVSLQDRNTSPIAIRVRTNAGVTAGTLRIVTLPDDVSDNTPQVTIVALTGTEPDTGLAYGFVKWDATLPASYARFANGEYNWIFSGTDQNGDTLSSTGVMRFQDGTVDQVVDPGATPSATPSPSPTATPTATISPSPTASPNNGSGTLDVTNLLVSNICVDNQWDLTQDFTVTVSMQGLTSSDGEVDVQYPHHSKKRTNKPPDKVATNGADYVTGGNGGSTWTLTVSAGSQKHFEPGSTVQFTIIASRPSDGANTSETFSGVLVGTC